MSDVVSVRHLAMMGREVNAALAAGRVTPDAAGMLAAGNAGRLFAALEEALGGLGYFDWIDGRRRAALNEEWARLANAVLVETFGLAPTAPGLFLVLAFVLESIKLRDPLSVAEPDETD